MKKDKCINLILMILWVIIVSVMVAHLYTMIVRYVVTEHTDINTHIKRALDGGGYSLNSVIYRGISFLSNALGIDAISLYVWYNIGTILASIIILALFVNEYITIADKNRAPFAHVLWISLSSLFICVIHINSLYPWFYRNLENPNLSPLTTQPWNSDTYNLMRTFSGGTLICFIILYRKIVEKEKLSLKEVVVFAALLFFTNLSKPSFVMCFAPSAFVLCMYDLLFNRSCLYRDHAKI